MARKILIALAALILLVMAGCGNDRADGPALENVTWELVHLNSTGSDEVAQPVAPITLIFAGGEISGSAGCNSYSGTYELNDASHVTVGPIAATEMACLDDAVMAAERDYLAVLQGTALVEVDNGVLLLAFAGVTLVFQNGSVTA